MTSEDAESILEGGVPPDRSDLAPVVRLAEFIRAAGSVEPAPPMRPELARLLDQRARPTG